MKKQTKEKLVLICNSELDGFNEGDGDLMEKLVSSLNQRDNYFAARIVYNAGQVPPLKKALVAENQLDILDNNPLKSLEDFKQRLFTLLFEKYGEYKEKIFYIGSRFDKVTHKDGLYDINGSGSYFTSDVILKLQQLGFKVVFCCLEYKFFRRSINQLSIAATMLKEQLFYADGIHFLNRLDLLDFKLTIDQLLKSPFLQPLHGVVINDEYHQNRNIFDCSSAIVSIGGPDKLKALIRKAVYTPGIYTVDPIPISNNIPDTIEKLAGRPNNILCFGLIRRHKGIEEAIRLAETLHQNGDQRTIFIVGKVMGSSILYLRSLLKNIYDFSQGQYSKIALELLNSNYQVNNGLDSIVSANDGKIDFTLWKENTLNGGKEELNRFCNDMIKRCQLQFNKKINIVFLLNLPEPEVRNIAMQCRYAIKLDHKGMADNASTIASCLGMCLPTFTTCGLLTDDCFRDPDVHKPTLAHEGSYQLFCRAVIMPPERYDNSGSEVTPINFTPAEIYDILKAETVDMYSGRIADLIALRGSGMFEVGNVVTRLQYELFEDVVFRSSQPDKIESIVKSN